MARKHSESGARPSNAGDRYHLVYVARRLLDLLHPYSRLTQLVIENVSPADEAAHPDPKTFLGVDVAEYYGGENLATAEALDLVQVKYSPLRPGVAWTLSRLTTKKRRGDSIFRKLAEMFDALAPSVTSPSHRARVTIRLLTNQPLSPQLRQDLEVLKGLIEDKSPPAAGRALATTKGRAGGTASTLLQTSGLSWTRLSMLLAAWDLDGFGHPWLSHTEAALFEALSGFSRDGSVQLAVLLNNLQVHATPGQRETFRRADVLAALHLREDHFLPAPTEFQDDDSLFETRSSVLVRQAIEQGDGQVVIHGRSGSGKTSALRLALRHHGDGNEAVLYDCYAAGQGLLPGAERFPYNKCFTQVINELDARYRTGILATVGLDYQGLLHQLDRALKAAAIVAKQEGHRLVLAFDAIDNASEQERRAPYAGTSFVPLLWRIGMPSNCILIVSLRTENLLEVVGESMPDARPVEIMGFDDQESQRHANQLAPLLSHELVKVLYERTAGNPRVQRNVLKELASHPLEDAHRIIQQTARKTAFDYYDQESKRRLVSAEVRRVLAVLYEMRQAPKLVDVSAITGLAEQELRDLIGRLSFGLRLDPEGHVGWQDQDFLDWTRERLSSERQAARPALAEHCVQSFEKEEYARWNFSYHLLQAGQLDRLVAWWREPGRLDEQIRAAHPHEERVLDDLRAALLAALHIGQIQEAFGLLLRAADIAEGRDVFASALLEHSDIAVAADLAHLIPRLRGHSEHTAFMSLRIAAEFARQPERQQTARDVFAQAKANKDAERVRDPEHGGRLSLEEWEVYAQYQNRCLGLSEALTLLKGRQSSSWTRSVALTVGSDWLMAGVSEPLDALANAVLGPGERAAAALGILSALDPDRARGVALRSLAPAAVEAAVEFIVGALTPFVFDPMVALQSDPPEFVRDPGRIGRALGTAIENLTAAGLPRAARSLLAIWSHPRPQDRSRGNLERYLRCMALREALSGMPFDPAAYELRTLPETGTEKTLDLDGSWTVLPARSSQSGTGEREREEEIRREMKRSYPPLRVRALAWASIPAEEISEEIRRIIAHWKTVLNPFEAGFEGDYQEKAAILLEAILALPGSHVQLVREVIEAAERILGDSRGLVQIASARVLSRDERYLAEAERLIHMELERCRPPEIAAREAIDRLFRLYSPAVRINPSLGRRVIIAAREVASEIDSRIYARAKALTAIAEAAQQDLAPARLDELCALTCYWWSVDQSAQDPGERALTLLARKDPGAGVTRAWELDQRGLLDFEDGLGRVAIGALAAASLLAEDIWPILPLLKEPTMLDAVARGSIEQFHERGLPVEIVLSAYCRLSRLEGAARNPVERALEIVRWAETRGLGLHRDIQAMRTYVDGLGAALAEEGARRRLPELEDSSPHRAAANPLFDIVSEHFLHSPRSALAQLEEAAAAELRELTLLEFSSLLTPFLEALPLSDRPRLVAVIERWGAMDNGPEALPLLDALLADNASNEPDLVRTVAESFRRLLTPDTLTSIEISAVFQRRQELTSLIHGRWAPPAARLEAILGAVAEHLRELGSDTLFFLAGQAAQLLKPPDLAYVAQDFIAHTMAEAPALGDPAVPGKERKYAIPHALTLALGNPRQALRWRGVYAVTHALVDTEEPESFLRPLLDAFDSTDLPRWLSVREWLAFALEHVSLRKPGSLRSAVPRLLPHAASRELPHAKIRHHLKQALLAVEKNFPGTVGVKALTSLELVNRPIAVVRRKPDRSNAGWENQEQSWDRESEASDDEDLLTPGFMDTVHYWYQPLARCFAGDGTRVQGTIVRVAADWMARLGVTRSAVEAERLQLGERYDWGKTNNYHGSQPRVELLRLYGERHGLYLAAGELIDTIPVLESMCSDGSGNEWDDWARGDLRGADPALPARLLDAPPPLADNYGVFTTSVEDWRKKEEPDAFSGELEVTGDPRWIIVASNREAFEYDRSFSATVQSALVSPQTARALSRLLQSDSRDAFLPVLELNYASSLPKLEMGLEAAELRPYPLRGEHNAADGLFVLRAWAVQFYQEAPLHGLDPLWPRNGRHYGLPALDVARRLGWTRHPTELLWREAGGGVVARCDLWRRSDRSESRSSEGYRFVMRRDAISAYTREVGLEVIFAVRLRRQGRSSYRASENEEFDLGTTRCFLWSDLTRADATGGSFP